MLAITSVCLRTKHERAKVGMTGGRITTTERGETYSFLQIHCQSDVTRYHLVTSVGCYRGGDVSACDWHYDTACCRL